MSSRLVSIIVPIKNSGSSMSTFLEALKHSRYQNIEVIINDDITSTDNSEEIAEKYKSKGLSITYLKENISMAQGRRSGAHIAKGNILIHLDSDMQVTKSLIGECADKINCGFDALVIPEESYGISFWARCKCLEKKCYEGIGELESLRCITKNAYRVLNGHNENMVFSEDKDLDIRAREAGFNIGRTEHHLLHNEGSPTLRDLLRKKTFYSASAGLFRNSHYRAYLWQRNPLNRYVIFAKNFQYLFTDPLVYIGLFFLKTAEYVASGYGIASQKLKEIRH